MSDLLNVDAAIARIIHGVVPVASETVPLAAAGGRILSEALSARRTQPPFTASAMDGYAVRAPDVTAAGATLSVIGTSAAGHGFHAAVGPGQAVRIFTGAPVPAGTDAILIQEDAEPGDGGTIRAREAVRVGQNIRPLGFDFTTGDALLEPGRRLDGRAIALAAAMGFAAVAVRRRPRVAIIATGDELVPAGVTPAPDQIVGASAPGIAALVERVGGEAIDFGIVRDNRAATTAIVNRAMASSPDIIVTLGGASVGDHDLVRPALAAAGMVLDFWRIAMRPGKPLLFGRLAGGSSASATRVLGLPGNPVSSLVCALLFLRPLVDALLGLPITDPSEPALLAAGMPANDRREDYVRGTLEERPGAPPLATAFPRQDSSLLGLLAAADCLIIRAPHAPAALMGEACRIIRLA